MTSLIDGFLLTRQWRDTNNGIELSFWLATDQDPVRLVIENERAVCFIRRENQLKIPQSAQRKQLKLKDFDHAEMDGLYFRQQRDMQAMRDHLAYDKSQLYESEVKPTERYLMERFITAPMTVQGMSFSTMAIERYANLK